MASERQSSTTHDIHHHHCTPAAGWHKLLLAGVMAAALTACGGGSSADEADATAEEAATAATESTSTSSGSAASGSTASGSASTTTAADAYVGKWSRCKANDGGESGYYTVINKKTGSNTVRTSLSLKEYTSNNCSGASVGSYSTTSDLTVQGTKTVSGKTVYKATIYQHGASYGPNPSKTIHWFDGNRLYEAAKGSTDSEGYPNSLDMANPWYRQ